MRRIHIGQSLRNNSPAAEGGTLVGEVGGCLLLGLVGGPMAVVAVPPDPHQVSFTYVVT